VCRELFYVEKYEIFSHETIVAIDVKIQHKIFFIFSQHINETTQTENFI
jgi:hypothetical protein